MFRLRPIHVATVLGIPIEIDVSWFLVFVLIAGVLAFDLFPSLFPGRGLAVDLVSGVVSAALFFASLVAHEFSHSLVARRSGIRVERITLFVFGGVAQLSEEPRGPRDEFAMAIAGPLASVTLAAVFAALTAALLAAGVGDVLWGPAAYLAAMNLALATFNLAPGFPMDGGRVLRSYLWWATGDKRRATFAASGGGALVSAVLVAAGVSTVLGGDLSGLWIVLVGAFLGKLAIDAYRGQRSQLAMAAIPVSDASLAGLPSVGADVPAAVAALAASRSRSPLVAATSGGSVVGVFASEALTASAARGEDAAGPADPRLLVDASESVEGAWRRVAAGAPALVVVRGGRVLGVATPEALADASAATRTRPRAGARA